MKKEMLEKVLNAHKNLIIEGDIASGKTTNVLFPIIDNVIEKNESLFILDSKEEYINRYFKKLKSNNYNIIILNLRDMDKSEGWNPLEYPYKLYKNGQKDQAQEYLEKIGKTMFYENSTQDPFWSLTASDFFTGVAFALFEDGREDEVNFNSINNMFNGIDKRYGVSDYLTEYFKKKDTSSKSYIFASATFLAPRDTRGGILSVARQKLRLYVSREKLSQIMNKTTFNVDDVVSKPTAIFVIARDENKSLNTIASMFIEQLYAMLVDLISKIKFNFVLDNFDIIEKCNDLVDILDSCVARNIKTFIVTRSLSELINIYGSYMPKLCDLISIENSKVKLTIDRVEEEFDKDFETVDIVEENIDYPKLNETKINLFDLEKSFSQYISTSTNVNKNDYDSLNLDDYIKKIDEKIKQLEEEEKQLEINSEKSELEQFKTKNIE
jgi:type IV secretion system protein VirD4